MELHLAPVACCCEKRLSYVIALRKVACQIQVYYTIVSYFSIDTIHIMQRTAKAADNPLKEHVNDCSGIRLLKLQKQSLFVRQREEVESIVVRQSYSVHVVMRIKDTVRRRCEECHKRKGAGPLYGLRAYCMPSACNLAAMPTEHVLCTWHGVIGQYPPAQLSISAARESPRANSICCARPVAVGASWGVAAPGTQEAMSVKKSFPYTCRHKCSLPPKSILYQQLAADVLER